MANINVKCNFAQVFAQYENAEDVKSVANAIVEQLKKDYAARIEELGGSVKGASVKVDASASGTKDNKKSGTKTDKKPAKKEEKKPKTTDKKEKKAKEKTAQIALTDTKTIKKFGFVWKDYSEKAFVLASDADTKCLHDALTELGGRWNGRLKDCGEGSWIFSKAKSEKDVKKAMKGLYKVAKAA